MLVEFSFHFFPFSASQDTGFRYAYLHSYITAIPKFRLWCKVEVV